MPVDDASDLYGLPLEQFVAERAALAKVLRGEGRREEAKRVALLRKPSLAAWAVNQLVRSQSTALADLFVVGDELSRVHADLLDGRSDPDALRAVIARERDAVDRLTEAARGLLSAEGHELSAATLDRVSDTLHAAALDQRARDAVRGCLERELRLVGLGSDAAVSGPVSLRRPAARSRPARPLDTPSADRAHPPERQAAAEQTEREREREQVERQRAERETAARITAARRAESDARRHADRTARALTVAQQRRERAAEVLHDADAALARAQERAEDAARAHRSAQQALQSADRPLASPE
ncbi:MAG: hypothetical protein ACLP50_17340 [Solirubrobacteraceae bacterium]